LEAPTKVCVVVPTYNERENIEATIAAVEMAKIPGLSLLFVDDSSPDGTADEVKRAGESRPWVKLLVRRDKMGIGSAYQDGFKAAFTLTDPTILVEMDADLQHPASGLPSLVDAIRGGADVALASRYVNGGGISDWSLARRTVSRGANFYARTFLQLPVKDATSGFRAYARLAAEEVAYARLPAKGFEFQVAALYLLKGHSRIVEVPYMFVSRKAGKSKLGLWDVIRFFFAVARMSLS
jgi:dolichol-phosphate mannosyltransferase